MDALNLGRTVWDFFYVMADGGELLLDLRSLSLICGSSRNQMARARRLGNPELAWRACRHVLSVVGFHISEPCNPIILYANNKSLATMYHRHSRA